jgi:hypothetical protein
MRIKIQEVMWSKYLRFEMDDFSRINNFIKSWNVSAEEFDLKEGAAELFDKELNSLGLASNQFNLIVDKALENFKIDKFIDAGGNNSTLENLDREIFSRAATQSLRDSNLAKWRKDFDEYELKKIPDTTWPKIQTHIGDTQRKLKKIVGENSTMLIIEPLFIHSKLDKEKKLGFGMAFSIMGPQDYDVRIIGFRKKIENLNVNGQL